MINFLSFTKSDYGVRAKVFCNFFDVNMYFIERGSLWCTTVKRHKFGFKLCTLLILVYSTELVFAQSSAPEDRSTAWGGPGPDAEQLTQPGKARRRPSCSDLALTPPNPPRVYCCLLSNQTCPEETAQTETELEHEEQHLCQRAMKFLGKDFYLHFTREWGERAFKKQYVLPWKCTQIPIQINHRFFY